MTIKSIGSAALREHLLNDHKVSLLDALLLFGVQSLNRELTTLKRDGFLIKKEKVPMSKVLRRLNEYAVAKAPDKLPIREIMMTEYWISK